MGESSQVRRLLMTADTVGGVWTYALDLSKALSKRGIAVDLATMGATLTPPQARAAAAIGSLTVHESSYQLEWMQDPWSDVERAGDWLLTLENDLNPDVVHLNGYCHGNLPWRAPHIVAGHSCVLSWWSSVKGEEAPPRWSRYRSAVTTGLRAADLVVAPSHAMMAQLQKYYGPLPSTAVIANGRDSEPYAAGEKEPFILAAGRVWDEAKNIGILERVRRAVDWPILVAGDARHPDGRAARLGNIKLLGVLDVFQLASYYSRAAIYCLPAKYEPFGLSVVEAALSGCALVLGDIPSLRENWDGAAVFVPPGDAGELAWALQDLIVNPGYRTAMAGVARARALRFTTDRMAESYLAVYSRLASSIPSMAAGD